MRKPIFSRLVAGLLVLLLLVGVLPTALAAESEPAKDAVSESPTAPTETAPDEQPAQPDEPTEPTEESTEPTEATDPTKPVEAETPSVPTTPEEAEIPPVPVAAANGGVTVVGKPSLDVPDGNRMYFKYYDVWDADPSYVYPTDDKRYWVSNFTCFQLSTGQTAFCIQPSKHGPENSTVVTPNSGWGTLSRERRNGIALALAYGAPNNGDTSESGLFATAAVVWDMACGYRKESGKFTTSATSGMAFTETEFGKWLHNSSAEAGAKYDAIIAKLARHGTRPSFTAKFAPEIGTAQTITLTYDAASGLYKGSATDTNKVLEDFNFISTIDGLTFAKSGNTLNVTATEAAAKQVAAGVTIKNRGHEVEISPDVCLVYTSDASSSDGGSSQLVATLSAATDPVPCYFKLQAEVPDGSLTIEKTSTHGAGSDKVFPFRIYCPDGTYLDRTLKIGESVTLTDLTYGTYVVAEWFTSGWECTNAESTTIDQARWTVTVPSGGTVTVVANNEPLTGTGKFVKTTNTGENLGGWTIPVYTDEACTQHYTTVVTGEDGTISAELPVGIYYAKETVTDDPYWVCDSRVVKFEIKRGETTEVHFENTHMGRIEIVKQTSDGENLEGWQFAVYADAECTRQVGELLTSGADGRIGSANLLPITYWIKEIGNVDPEIAKLYDCPTEAQEVTVTAGQTASVTFENVLKTGKIVVAKEDTRGNRLAGATFLLEWSLDGTTWTPVTFSETAMLGGCSTEGIENGSLTTGGDGLITFDGLAIRSEGKWITYRLTETKAPNGFSLHKDHVFVGTLEKQMPEDAEAFTVEKTVHNSRGYMLPATGNFTSLLLPLLGTLLCLLTSTVMWKRKHT